MVIPLILLVLGLLAFMAPFAIPAFPVPWVLCVVLGAGLVVLSIIVAFFQLYKKTKANEAFVRTGQGGQKAVVGGGSVVIPILHNTIPISLETMKLEVVRRAQDALITQDNLRVDIAAEFYINVQPDDKAVLQAAKSLGEKGTSGDQVSKLVFEKLVSALRSVAATKTLSDLHTKRTEFAEGVSEAVQADLQHNGLTLETVTISQLDQTDPASLSDNNIFDAQGKKVISDITQKATTERTRIEEEQETQRNMLVRAAEEQRRQQDVETRKRVLALEQAEKEAEAETSMQVANAQAAAEKDKQQFAVERQREIRESQIAAELEVQRKDIERQKALEVAEAERQEAAQSAKIAQEKAVETANIARDQSVKTAREQEEQAVLVASESKKVAVAKAQAERAAAEAEALTAEAEREKAEQAVLTVEETEKANRDAEIALIDARRSAEDQKIRQEREADVKAYALTTMAEADRTAAALRAEAAKLDAEALQAKDLVPVNVEREKVNVDRERVAVKREELSAEAEFQEVAVELEKLRISTTAQVEIGKAQAEAMGKALANAQMQIWGDGDTLRQMTSAFSKGQSVGALAEGVMDTLPPEVKIILAQLASKAGTTVDKLTSAAVTKLLPPDGKA